MSAMFKRRLPDRTGPLRGAGGFYRTSEAKGRAQSVPLNNANDAVVAAVRMAYKVAEAQVDRSTRLARRLRESGDRQAGEGSDQKALDATERLVMKTIMSALEWWETSVAQGRCPVRRLAAAEYRMMGTILGFEAPAASKSQGVQARDKAAEPRNPRSASAQRLRIKHDGQRRAVRVTDWQFHAAGPLDPRLEFFGPEDSTTLKGMFSMQRNVATLRLEISQNLPSGAWKAAICSQDGEQLGFIELVI